MYQGPINSRKDARGTKSAPPAAMGTPNANAAKPIKSILMATNEPQKTNLLTENSFPPEDTFTGENAITQAAFELNYGLIEKYFAVGVKVAANHYNDWPLHFVAYRKAQNIAEQIKIGRWLVNHGDSVWHENAHGYRPIDIATLVLNTELVKILFRIMQALQPDMKWINKPNQFGQTLIHLFCSVSLTIDDNGEERKALRNLLLPHGDPEIKDKFGYTPLNYASNYYHYLGKGKPAIKITKHSGNLTKRAIKRNSFDQLKNVIERGSNTIF